MAHSLRKMLSAFPSDAGGVAAIAPDTVSLVLPKLFLSPHTGLMPAYLYPVKTTPWMKYFCVKKKTTISGSMTTSDTAMSEFHSVP